MKTTLPTVKAYLHFPPPGSLGDPSPMWTFWCSYCKTWHNHGVVDTTVKVGADLLSRVAHCGNHDSPYRKTGYRLEAAGLLPPQSGWPRRKPPAALMRDAGWDDYAPLVDLKATPQHGVLDESQIAYYPFDDTAVAPPEDFDPEQN